MHAVQILDREEKTLRNKVIPRVKSCSKIIILRKLLKNAKRIRGKATPSCSNFRDENFLRGVDCNN